MYCQTCGTQLAADAPSCIGCGASAAPPDSRPAPTPFDLMLAAGRDAVTVLKACARDPVGGLDSAAATLSPERRREVALVFGVFFDLAATLGSYKVRNVFGSSGLGTVAALLILGLVPVASLTGAVALTRKACHGSGSLGGDLLIATTSLLPVAFLTLLGALLGVANVEVLAVAGVFAACYVIYILYGGCRHMAAIPASAAAPAVPLLLLVTAWLTKIIYAALL
jgi:hypothetical protein